MDLPLGLAPAAQLGQGLLKSRFLWCFPGVCWECWKQSSPCR